MDSNDYVTIEHILSEVTSVVNDTEYRSGLSKGWYISRIQDALQELAFDTFFDIQTRDYDFPSGNLQMELPKNCFNIREIYGWNGSCCSPQTSAVIYTKRLFNNKGGNGRGYTAQVKRPGETIGTDPFQPNYSNDGTFTGFPENVYTCNIQNGIIMFSSSCEAFQKVRIVFNGMGGEIGDLPIVPRFFERAVNDYVKMLFYEKKMGEDPRMYSGLYDRAKARYDDWGGNWKKAEKRIKLMNAKERADYKEYLAAIYVK